MHECGHAIVGESLGFPVDVVRVSLWRKGRVCDAFCRHLPPARGTPAGWVPYGNAIATKLAGEAAEDINLSYRTRHIRVRAVDACGVTVPPEASDGESTARLVRASIVHTVLSTPVELLGKLPTRAGLELCAWRRARQILRVHRVAFAALVFELTRRPEVSGDEVRLILSKSDTDGRCVIGG
jgi:hypothetical protein